ncbi:HEAT repeat domain-containing protein [Nannocystis sp. ILAH1]|uniref:HEAT repeat domain-containing protein n=1 Tax=unclassified Nannocystis TaxID=2627009 RepID=UPI00226E862C|nr:MULTISPECIES: HEAT repeat domain-containing protein [unclassified Nannocystis]MCY0994196.1 HEAT repeat domain-containing protein [Nannocystis sp. ILAH1]MCY1063976.1 HEAT repeat domain-containing protein [Nannocystis sp. RBIL2]
MAKFRKKMEAMVGQFPPETRASAQQDLERLWQAGVETYDDLLAVAEGEHEVTLREIACAYLASLGDRRALPTLARCLVAESDQLRCEAARCLGNLGDADAIAPLVQCLESDPDSYVRMYAAHALGVLADERAFEALRAALHRSDEAPHVRGMAAESLACLFDRRAIDELLLVLDDPSAEVRYWAVFALGQLGDASLIPWLRPLLADHECPPGLIPISQEVADTIHILEHSTKERDLPDA